MSRTVPTPAAPPAGPTARRESERERRHDIDLLRVVCTAAAAAVVVLVHASAEFIHGGHRTTGVVGDSAGRSAVPAFFAMAGWAALAGSPVRGEAQLLTRLGRILRPMAVWTALYLLWQFVAGPPLDDGAEEVLCTRSSALCGPPTTSGTSTPTCRSSCSSASRCSSSGGATRPAARCCCSSRSPSHRRSPGTRGRSPGCRCPSGSGACRCPRWGTRWRAARCSPLGGTARVRSGSRAPWSRSRRSSCTSSPCGTPPRTGV
ncbi:MULTISPECIES: acyltransferase family protein [unclassified Streptomyces]|uniref:acyltransferase family protein n=1 Tax=unclassified Streptomyces TaxID=2593676 RepID=UPI0021561741|nr:acyltransferase family protein [Streptomyces sp. SM1]